MRADPARLLADAGYEPDDWQTQFLRGRPHRALLNCSRQSGKSLCGAAAALGEAMFRPAGLVLLLSRSLRQSGELFRDKLLAVYNRLGRPVPAVRETQLELVLANGSRVVSLPGDEGNIRCFSGARALFLDEASRIPDPLYRAVRPMLATSGGRLVAMSTPFGRRGWWYEEWQGERPWRRVSVTADQVSRIPPSFLAEERAALGAAWYAQEYFGAFLALVNAALDPEAVARAMADTGGPLFGE